MNYPDLFNQTPRGAEFSPCGKYRYKLWRVWNDQLPLVMCIGLNPSTANSDKDDPTIRLLCKMLSKLGYGGFYMTNLFAFVSSRPDSLLTCTDPVAENDQKLKEVAAICKDVIVCWGSWDMAHARIDKVLPNYPQAKCFGVNKNGTPLHPMGLMYNGRSHAPQLFFYSELNYPSFKPMKCKFCKDEIAIHEYDAGFAFTTKSPLTFRQANFHGPCYELEIEAAKQTPSKNPSYQNRYDQFISNHSIL